MGGQRWDSRPVPSGCGEADLPQGHGRQGAGVPGQGLGLWPPLPLGCPRALPLTLPPPCVPTRQTPGPGSTERQKSVCYDQVTTEGTWASGDTLDSPRNCPLRRRKPKHLPVGPSLCEDSTRSSRRGAPSGRGWGAPGEGDGVPGGSLRAPVQLLFPPLPHEHGPNRTPSGPVSSGRLTLPGRLVRLGLLVAAHL